MTNVPSSGLEPGQRRLNRPQTTGREYRNLSQRIWRSARSAAVTKAPDLPHPSRFCLRRVEAAPEALFSRDETETPHEHVTSDIGSGETAPALAVGSPVVDHGVRRGLRNYTGVRGQQHAVNVELD